MSRENESQIITIPDSIRHIQHLNDFKTPIQQALQHPKEIFLADLRIPESTETLLAQFIFTIANDKQLLEVSLLQHDKTPYMLKKLSLSTQYHKKTKMWQTTGAYTNFSVKSEKPVLKQLRFLWGAIDEIATQTICIHLSEPVQRKFWTAESIINEIPFRLGGFTKTSSSQGNYWTKTYLPEE